MRLFHCLVAVVCIGYSGGLFGVPFYEVVDLGPGYANDINNLGEVVGRGFLNADTQDTVGYVWNKQNGFQEVSSRIVEVTTINDLGFMLGETDNGYGDRRGHLLNPSGEIIGSIPLDNTPSTKFHDLNNSNVVATSSVRFGKAIIYPEYWETQDTSHIISFNGSGSVYALNDLGDLVGSKNGYVTIWHNDGGQTTLNDDQLNWNNRLDINNKGHVIGYFEDSNGNTSAFFYDGTTTHKFGTAGKYSPYPYDLNERDQVVGGHYEVTDNGSAFIYQNNVVTYLNNTIDQSSGWNLLEARGINDSGQIVGYGVLDGETRGFLLNPVVSMQTSSPPQPTSTPDISAFPRPERLIEQLAADFMSSPEADDISAHSRDFINTRIQSLGSLVDPHSEGFLKSTVKSVADGLYTVGFLSTMAQAAATGDIVELEKAIGLHFAPDWLHDASDSVDAVRFLAQKNVVYASWSVINMTWGRKIPQELDRFAVDPPGDDFTRVVSPGNFYSLRGDYDEHDGLNSILQRQFEASAQAYLYLRAANDSFDLYAGAYQEGDAISAILQLEAFLDYMSKYDIAMQTAGHAILEYHNLLLELGREDGDLGIDLFSEMQSNVSDGGFSPEAMQFFEQMGFSESDIAIMRSEIVSVDSALYEDKGRISIMSDMSDAFFMGSSIPEPNTLLLLVFCALCIQCRRRTNVS